MGFYSWGTDSQGTEPIFPDDVVINDSLSVNHGPLNVGTSGQTDPVQIKVATQDASAKYWMTVDQFDNSSSPHNQVFEIGWNVNQSVASEPVLRDSWESNYLTGGVRYMERHWQYTSDDGGTSRRPLTLAIRRDTDVVDIGFYADNIRLGNAAGSVENWTLTGAGGRLTSNNTAASGSIMFQRTASSGEDRALIGADLDASGGTFSELLRISSAVGHGPDTVYWDLQRQWPRMYFSSPECAFLPGGTVHVTISRVSGADRFGVFGIPAVIQQADTVALTSVGVSADRTLVDVTTAGVSDPAKVNANFDDVADAINDIRTLLRAYGWMA